MILPLKNPFSGFPFKCAVVTKLIILLAFHWAHSVLPVSSPTASYRKAPLHPNQAIVQPLCSSTFVYVCSSCSFIWDPHFWSLFISILPNIRCWSQKPTSWYVFPEEPSQSLVLISFSGHLQYTPKTTYWAFIRFYLVLCAVFLGKPLQCCKTQITPQCLHHEGLIK